MKKSRSRILWFDAVCGVATLFKSEACALDAAKEESKARGYPCEIVPCDKEHTQKNGKVLGPGFHVRGVNFH